MIHIRAQRARAVFTSLNLLVKVKVKHSDGKDQYKYLEMFYFDTYLLTITDSSQL